MQVTGWKSEVCTSQSLEERLNYLSADNGWVIFRIFPLRMEGEDVFIIIANKTIEKGEV